MNSKVIFGAIASLIAVFAIYVNAYHWLGVSLLFVLMSIDAMIHN